MDTKKLRQKILDLAIRGKLVPQDPNDEPASVLLERIRAEKERLIKEGKIKRSKKVAADDEIEAPFEIPESWEWVRLEDFVMAVTDGDHQPPPQSTTGVPFLVISDVNKGFIDFSHARFVSEEYYNNLPTIRQATKGDILFTVTGSYGIPILVDTEQIFCFQRHIGLIKTISCSEWLKVVLYSTYVHKYCDKVATGTAQKTVSLGHLRDLAIPIPPLAEQKRIVNEVEKWFALIDELENNESDLLKAIDKAKSKILDLAIHGKLVPQDPNDEPAIELLKRINPKFEPCENEQLENLPQGWCSIHVGDLAKYTNGKAFKPSDWEKEGIPIIRIQNLNDATCKYNYTSQVHEEKYRIQRGNLLFAWAASLGVYIWDGDDAWLNQHIFKVEPYSYIEKEYCYYLFQYLIADFYNRSHGSGMVHITKNEFEKTFAFLPPKAEQLRIVAKIEELFAVLDGIKEYLN